LQRRRARKEEVKNHLGWPSGVYLNDRAYDVIIVDIRIPPGKDQDWYDKFKQLQRRKETNSNRLGLELLRSIFDEREDLIAVHFYKTQWREKPREVL